MLTENERKVLTEWNEFVKRVPPSIEGLRTNYKKWSEEQNKDLPPIESYEEGVTLRPGLTADVAVPKGPGPYPVLLYLHGGGWVAGSARTHKKVAAELAARGYLTFNLDYRLAPEYQFPAGLVDCVFAANWISENAKRWNGDREANGRGRRLGGRQSCCCCRDCCEREVRGAKIRGGSADLRCL